MRSAGSGSLAEVSPRSDDLAAAIAGDARARQRLYEQVAGPVFALISRLIRLPAAREDIFQDSLMAVFEHLGSCRGEAPFSAWVRRIAVNRCFMYLRSPWQRARVWLADEADCGATDGLYLNAGSTPAEDGTHQDLQRLLAGLAPTARAVVWLHEVEGWSHEEIAGACGRSVSFSKSQLARAQIRLRELALPAPRMP